MPDDNATSETSLPSSSRPLTGWLSRHQEKLWWLHSGYALLLGIGVMWLGRRNFAFLRVAVFHLGFIWLASFFLPKILAHPRLPPRWAPRLRLLVNFFTKNLYQQMLFFVLPIYYASATLGSRNIIFIFLVGVSATLSTLDLVYDRHLSARRGLTAAFFAFNLFALINVMLPVLWSVSNTTATRLGAVLAASGFLTLHPAPLPSRNGRLAFGALIAFLFIGAVEWGRPFIPPAPLRLAAAEFGVGFEKETLRVTAPVSRLDPGAAAQLYGLTAIRAPLGLKERVQQRWYKNGGLVCASPFYNVIGGRGEGFRLWTRCSLGAIRPDTTVRLDLETEGGQLIGRAALPATKHPPVESPEG